MKPKTPTMTVGDFKTYIADCGIPDDMPVVVASILGRGVVNVCNVANVIMHDAFGPLPQTLMLNGGLLMDATGDDTGVQLCFPW